MVSSNDRNGSKQWVHLSIDRQRRVSHLVPCGFAEYLPCGGSQYTGTSSQHTGIAGHHLGTESQCTQMSRLDKTAHRELLIDAQTLAVRTPDQALRRPGNGRELAASV